MSDRRITQEEVDKRTQTASERTSMTIAMPSCPENFPQFSQNEANGMQTEENAVYGHLAKTPTQEFANFNRQVNASASEVYKSPKQLSATGNGNRKEMETKSSIDANGNAPKVKPLTRKNAIKGKKHRRSPFQKYQHCSTKDLDNDNIQTDDENAYGYKYEHGDGYENGDENGDDDKPNQSLYKRILQFGFIKRRQNKKLKESMVLEFHKSTISVNILGAGSTSRDPAVISHLNDMNSNNARESEELSAGPGEIHNGAIVPDPSFNTQVLFSKEKTPPKIIEVEPVNRNITIIHKMVKESPEEPETSTWKLIRHRVSSWTGRLNPLRRWSQSGRDNEARISLRRNEADLGAFTRNGVRENADTRGTREAEGEVIRLLNPVDCARTCLISKSKSVRSVEPIIEDASNETRGESATLRRRPRVARLRREFAVSIDEVINLHGTRYQMIEYDIQASSTSRVYSETTTTSGVFGPNNRVLRSLETLALMSEEAGDSIQEDTDFGAPLCRHSSRQPSAEETGDTESDMNDNQHQIATPMVVAPAPEEPRGSRILENYTSTIAAINENCYLEVQRIFDALKDYAIKMETISESDLEEDSEVNQRSNSDPPSLAATMNTSESSMSVQQQSYRVVSRSNAIRRKRRSVRFEPYSLSSWNGRGKATI
ncbi:uncharacterized protein EAE97_010597 [Botrytis byssoidea]|uniref:Uncharacterized protein n=1 Tax=Botrytis byssoidea TaxID=139641 RepID=A0A9P5I074_9HELO|nr:uncharacterized protein EAE97_010597 [Botrytis byssoidea]KAF7924646.1 hypothetical protein EAE97_010597 [Botrytis byssoidea]